MDRARADLISPSHSHPWVLPLHLGATVDRTRETSAVSDSSKTGVQCQGLRPRPSPARAETLAEAVAIVQGYVLMHRIDGNIEPLRRPYRYLPALISLQGRHADSLKSRYATSVRLRSTGHRPPGEKT